MQVMTTAILCEMRRLGWPWGRRLTSEARPLAGFSHRLNNGAVGGTALRTGVENQPLPCTDWLDLHVPPHIGAACPALQQGWRDSWHRWHLERPLANVSTSSRLFMNHKYFWRQGDDPSPSRISPFWCVPVHSGLAFLDLVRGAGRRVLSTKTSPGVLASGAGERGHSNPQGFPSV